MQDKFLDGVLFYPSYAVPLLHGSKTNWCRDAEVPTKKTPTDLTIRTATIVIMTAVGSRWATEADASVGAAFFTRRAHWRRWRRRRWRTAYSRVLTGIV